jgi:hypothetical protein
MIDLASATEDDVVRSFESGLRSFLRPLQPAGSGVRRVTLRKEGEYPSDGEFAILFEHSEIFSLHLFALQFKRWDDGVWAIDNSQLQKLRAMYRVIAYALARPANTVLDNALHYYNLCSPINVPCDTTQIALGDANWHSTMVVGEKVVPHCSWGEFFQAIEIGGSAVTVPGGPGNPPDLDDDPDPGDIRDFGGIGLRIDCRGRWGHPWVRRQIQKHIRLWTSGLLQPPAAIIAYNSFTHALAFVEYVR